jgi:surfeit locus 1 family protein
LTNLKLRLFVLAALAAAVVFVRLGFWQLHRRQERRARNALVIARTGAPEVDVRALPHDSTESRFRRVRVTGTPDYDHELLWAARTHAGSPGVNLLTPVRIPGTDTAVIVNRGWIYSPDGATIDEAKWRERDSTFVGFADELPSVGGTSYTGKPRIIARLGFNAIAKALPYPVASTYVVMTGDSAIAADRVARLTIPPLDEGPHLSYAIQWFFFAATALVGVGYVIKQSRDEQSRDERSAATPASADDSGAQNRG